MDKRVIDVSGILDEETLHEYLSKELNFFGGYGFNFDVFWDCIKDNQLSQMPDYLVVEGLADLKKKLPDGAHKLLSCLQDYQKEFPERKVEYIEGSPSGKGLVLTGLEEGES